MYILPQSGPNLRGFQDFPEVGNDNDNDKQSSVLYSTRGGLSS